jgi:polysaccharide biosynthesis/export protein
MTSYSTTDMPKRWSYLFLLILLSFTAAYAQSVDPKQMSPQQLLKYYQMAKDSGMSDQEIEQAALARGFSLEDLMMMRKLLPAGSTQSASQSGSTTGRDTLGTVRRTVGRAATLPAQSSDLRSMLLAGESLSSLGAQEIFPKKNLKIFGASFFTNSAMSFEPDLRLATPTNYILGPEDELIVDIYGNSVENFRLKVNPEGTVRMLNLAPVHVNGLTVEQATERIISRLRTAYSGLNRSGTYATITLGNVRTIKVMVTGEVEQPGTYSVSSLATALNALYLSGGPTETGSYRKIEVIRNNNVIRKIDLYNFLVKADLRENISLRDQDIIMVYPYESRVEVKGAVKRPGLFETRSGETFQELLRYTGGFTTDAYSASVPLRRSTGREFKVNAVNEEKFSTFEVQNGDLFEVGKILDRYENRIIIAGAVMRPGAYALEEGCLTARQLIEKAEGLREDAFMNRALIHRRKQNYEPEVIAVNVRDLLLGKIQDIPLRKEDSLYIKSNRDLREEYKVTISGAVNKGGTYDYAEHLSVADLILMSGGFSEGAVPYRIEIARRVKEDTLGLDPFQNTRIFSIDVSSGLSPLGSESNFELQPFDIVFIRTSPRYESQKTVYVQGEVLYPGQYAILNNMERVTDLLRRAGGLKPGSYLEGGYLVRNKELVGLDMKSIIENPSLPANLLLQQGDSLTIPKQEETVRIQGQVLNPSIVNFNRGNKLRTYIAKAGGFTDKARIRKTYVKYPNGIVDQTRRYFVFNKYPRIEPGSLIIVPPKDESDRRQTSAGERAAIISVLGTLAITLVNILR